MEQGKHKGGGCVGDIFHPIMSLGHADAGGPLNPPLTTNQESHTWVHTWTLNEYTNTLQPFNKSTGETLSTEQCPKIKT